MGAQSLCSTGIQVTVTSVLPILSTLSVGGVVISRVMGTGVLVGGIGVSVGGTGVLVPTSLNVVK